MTVLEHEQQQQIEALTATVRHERERSAALEGRVRALETSRAITARLLNAGAPGPAPSGATASRRDQR
jgi:hypothetical protein